MRGMRFNDADAGKWRFRFMEMIRQDLLRAHEAGKVEGAEFVPQLLTYLGYGDVAVGDTQVSLAGGTEADSDRPQLIAAVRDEVIKIRRAHEELIIGAPDSLRFLGSALVMGARDYDVQMLGKHDGQADKDETLATGAYVFVTYTDLSTGWCVVEPDGMVRLAGCSAELGYVREYLASTPIDPDEVNLSQYPGLKFPEGRAENLDLALLNATVTAELEELELLVG